jgi:hypothetical protein
LAVVSPRQRARLDRAKRRLPDIGNRNVTPSSLPLQTPPLTRGRRP